MKILSSTEIKSADAYTLVHEPIASVDLMERAAVACFRWISHRFDLSHSFKIFCGTGNNGGDGLAIARLMTQANYVVDVFVVLYNDKKSDDFKINEQRLGRQSHRTMNVVKDDSDLPVLQKKDVVIDAIFGTGLNKPAEGLAAVCIRHINNSASIVIAIDMPSGLFADASVDHDTAIIKATHTLSFQVPKLAFLFSENDRYVGNWKILDIGLNEDYIDQLPSNQFLIDLKMVKSFLKTRKKFSHKGIFGHALLIAGSYGKIGAAVLAARSCLRTGTGLLTVHIPQCGYQVIQTSVPEAMVQTDDDESVLSSLISTDKFTAVGIGCGIGTEEKTRKAFTSLLSATKIPMVLDADAINILGNNKELLSLLPHNTILTPHPKEFERITEKAANDFHRHQVQLNFVLKYKVYVVLKGAHSCIACPDGSVYFNNTGNPGMAKGGSGDALTGIILSLLAQHYSPKEACILGVYVHGLAGDIAAKKMSMQSMIPSDLIENLGEAFIEIGEALS